MKDTHVLRVELSKTKILALKHAIQKRNSVFAEKRYLESFGLPNSTIGRENQAQQIMEYLYVPSNGSLPPFVSVFGRSGAGKSTIVKLVCDNLSNSLAYSFVNLRKSRSIFSCANLILSELDAEPVKSSEGIHKAIHKIQSRIKEILSTEKKNNFVLVLDEFDVIFSDTRSKPSDFVYQLLTMVESLRVENIMLCLVTVSNQNLADYSLDDRVKSRMDSYEVFFPPYNKDEIFSILKERSEKAFVRKINDDVLEYCAEISVDEHGDCRRALQLLRIAGEIANGDDIVQDHINQAAKTFDDDNLDLLIKSATPQQKLVLFSLAKLVLNTGKELHSTRNIYQTYQTLDTKNNRKLSYRSIFNLLKELENTGIIFGKIHSTGRHGLHNYYQLTEHYDIVGWAIDKDLWCHERDEKVKDDVLKYIEYSVFNPKKNADAVNKRAEVTRRYNKRFSL